MRPLRFITAIGLLLAYLSGVTLQAFHALVAHSEPHPVCSAESEQHIHGEEYHFDHCAICAFFVGTQDCEAVRPYRSKPLVSFADKIGQQSQTRWSSKSILLFYSRGPPLTSI